MKMACFSSKKSQILKSLSEKAKSATEFVTKLRALSDKIEVILIYFILFIV